MAFDVDRLLQLWTEPLPDDDEKAAAAFRELYADPVSVNGNQLTARDLVARARALQGVFEAAEREVLDLVETDGKVAVAFRLGGRQVGTLDTSAGPLAPTGQHLQLRVIDVLTLTEGRVSGIVMVADELGALAAVGAVRLPLGG
jgi:SnoaL-like polyketide cyclase